MINQKKKLNIGVVTATRAEYGLLKGILKELLQNEQCNLFLYVTGAHLSAAHGNTIQEIKQDGFEIFRCIDILGKRDDALGIANSAANALLKFAEAFAEFHPDVIVLLGDRYELIPIAQAALYYKIPIVHIGGGETTEGAIDEMIRHAMTKFSLLHFPSCELYRQRIIQMGEHPDRVFNLGDTGVENALTVPFLNDQEIKDKIELDLEKPIWLVTFHPETIAGIENSLHEQQELLAALETLLEAEQQIVFTGVNADEGGSSLQAQLLSWAEDKPLVKVVNSLGILLYINLLRRCKAVIGNSSSGIIEAPAIGVPTINIGDRQKGRMTAASILNIPAKRELIIDALAKVGDQAWQDSWANQQSPFYQPDAAQRIAQTIIQYFIDHPITIQKSFYDLPTLTSDGLNKK